MIYLLTNKKTGKDVAIGKTGIVCVDYKVKKVVAVPEILVARLQD